MEIIYALIGNRWRSFLFLMVLGAISAGLYAYGIKVIHDILSSENDFNNLLLVIALITASVALSLFSGQRMTKFYESRISELRIDLSRKVMKTEFEVIESNATKIVPILTSDVNTLTGFVKALPDSIVSTFKVIGVLIYMFWLSWQLSLFVVAVFCLILIVNIGVLGRVHKEERKSKEFNHDLHINVQGMVTGIKELVLNRNHHKSYIDRSVEPKSKGYADQTTILNNINLFLTKSSEWIVIIAISVLVILSSSVEWFTPDQFLKFFTLILFILPALIVVTSFFRGVKRMQVAVEKINELGLKFGNDENDKLILEDGLREADVSKSEVLVDINAVSYSYKTNKRVFTVGPISLRVNKNEILCVTGGNGSGKTTFSKILTGLYAAESGHIMYGDKEITPSLIPAYRDLYSAIFADSYVFQDLTYLKDSAMIPYAKGLIEMLELQDKISIDSLVISDVNLSFGQRGRVNLLRTILEDKPLMLFDEWAANQDPYFKNKFYREIIPELKSRGKTVIMISHDDNYYDVADRIVKLSEGKVVSITSPATA